MKLLRDSKGTEIFLPIFVFLLALAVRILPWQHVFWSNKVYLYDPDCYIRLRKILVYIGSFPQTYVYDYFQGFPKGTGVISSPAMEYLVAVFGYPFHNFSAFPYVLERVVALTPAVIGAVTAVVVYYFVKAQWGRFAAVCSGLVLALYPKHVEATILGRFDNEMVEPLLLLVTFWLYIRTYRDQPKVGWWVTLGTLNAVYLMAWRGALFPLAIIGLDLILRAFSHRKEAGRLRETGKGAALMYLTTAAIVGLICITDLWGTRGMFSYNIISWFHVALFVCAAFPFLLLYLYAGGKQLDRQRVIRFAGTAAIFLGIMAAFFAANIGEGLKVVAGGNAWIDSISQYQRLTRTPNLLLHFGWLSMLAPFALFLLQRPPLAELKWKRFLILWTLVMIVATFARNRYAEYLALNLSILAGMIVYCCNLVFAEKDLSRRWNFVAVLVLLSLQIPTYPYFSNLYRTGGTFNIKGDIEDTMIWLRNNTPLPGDPYRPAAKPAYGVLARWDYGGWLESIALRPSIATNYGTETYGMEEVARFLLASDETEMGKILERNKARYMVVDKALGDLPMYAGLIGNNARFFEERWNPQAKITEYLPSPEVFSLISSRLFFADGSLVEAAGIKFLPVESVRLVYESASPASVGGFPWEIKRLKVFEYLKGATVTVKGSPGKAVTISQMIETNQRRRFMYKNEKYFDKNGVATFKLFYERKASTLATGAVAPPQIASQGKERVLAVLDADISAGRVLEVTL